MANAKDFFPSEISIGGISIDRSPITQKISPEVKPSLRTRFKEQFVEGLGLGEESGLLSPTIGGVKGVASTISGASELGQKGLRALTPDIGGVKPEIAKIPEKYTEPKNLGEKVGFFLEQAAELGIPTSEVSKLSKTYPLLKRALLEGATAGTIASIQEGEVGKETAIAGVAGAALPIAGGAIKKALKPERLMSKALGFTKAGKTKIDKLATQGGFKNVDDFALEKGFTGDREQMLAQAGDLFENAKASKESVLHGITKKSPNKYNQLLEIIKKEYDFPGQESVIKEVDNLIKKKTLSAIDLDRIRYLADDILPKSAFTDMAPKKTEGIQKLIDPIRKTLEKLDPSGEIKKANMDKRILFEMAKQLEGSVKSNLVNQIIGRTAFRSLAGAGAIGAVPGAAPLAIGAAAFETITDFPQIASTLAQNLKKAGIKIPPEAIDVITTSLKGMIPTTTKKITD